jgi:hypothetical protein
VQVLDTNDNGPVFQSELYVFSVFENSTQPNAIGSVLAEDRDQGTLPTIILCACSYTLSSLY